MWRFLSVCQETEFPELVTKVSKGHGFTPLKDVQELCLRELMAKKAISLSTPVDSTLLCEILDLR